MITKGTRVRVVSKDPYAHLPKGTTGTVLGYWNGYYDEIKVRPDDWLSGGCQIINIKHLEEIE